MTPTAFARRRSCGRHRTVHAAASRPDSRRRSAAASIPIEGADAGTPPIQHRRCTDSRSEGAETAELSPDPRPQP